MKFPSVPYLVATPGTEQAYGRVQHCLFTLCGSNFCRVCSSLHRLECGDPDQIKEIKINKDTQTQNSLELYNQTKKDTSTEHGFNEGLRFK